MFKVLAALFIFMIVFVLAICAFNCVCGFIAYFLGLESTLTKALKKAFTRF